MNEEMRKQFTDFYKNQDKNVFTDNMNLDETAIKISHLGFNYISDFDIAIKELKSDLKDFDTLLEDYQNQIIEVTTKQNFFQKHPEKDFTNKTEKLIEQEKEIMEQVEKIKERKQKQLKNLEELEVARKEFMNNKKNTYHEEIKERVGITAEPDANGKIDPKGKYGSIESSVFGQLERAKKELENLRIKVLSGTANEFDKSRYEMLKEEIIPELENRLPYQKEANLETENSKQEEPDEEIIEEEEAEELNNEPKFKKIWKKALKIAGILGGIALIGGAIYQLTQGDSEQATSIIQNAADATRDVAESAIANDNLNGTDLGSISSAYDTNIDALQNVNAEKIIPECFQDNVLGYATPDNQMVSVDSLQSVVDAHDNGTDISSLYVGNDKGIDGFVNQVNGKTLEDFLSQNGGKVR